MAVIIIFQGLISPYCNEANRLVAETGGNVLSSLSGYCLKFLGAFPSFLRVLQYSIRCDNYYVQRESSRHKVSVPYLQAFSVKFTRFRQRYVQHICCQLHLNFVAGFFAHVAHTHLRMTVL